jgi:hypothetical protein
MNKAMNFSPEHVISDAGQIATMRIPAGWREGKHEQGGVGFRSLRAFFPVDDPEVSISIFYRGHTLSEEGTSGFRKYLEKGPGTIFIARGSAPPSDEERLVFTELRESLGNAGNNQIINTQEGWRGASFNVERIEIIEISGKNVMSVTGWFRDPEEDQRLSSFAGLFVETNTNDPESGIQELFIEAPDSEAFKKYLPHFNQAVRSIQWKGYS